MLRDINSELFIILEGGMLVISLACIVFFFKIKKKMYLYYSLYFFSLFFFIYNRPVLPLSHSKINHVWGQLASYIFYTLFTIELLDTKTNLKRWHKYLQIACGYSVINLICYVLLNFLGTGFDNMRLGLYVVHFAFYMVFAPFMYFWLYKMKDKIANYLIIGSFSFLFLSTINNLCIILIGEKEFIMKYGFNSLLISYVGCYIEASMFAYIMGEKQKRLNAENLRLKEQFSRSSITLANNTTVFLDDLTHVQSQGHYLYFYLKNSHKEVIRGKISDILEQLPPNFIQCHRSYVVNKNFISRKTHNILFLGEVEIPLSRTFKDSF